MIPKNSTSLVSVIVRTNHSERIIGESLTCLFTQYFQNFELTVIDYSSKDRTRNIVREFPCQRFMVPAKKYNPGLVLNQAIAKTSGRILVFLNADAILVSPNSLFALIQEFVDPNVKAVFGRQVPRMDATNPIQSLVCETFPEKGNPPEWLPFSMVFGAIRRSAWMKHPFSQDTPGMEDVEWGMWAKRKGYSIRYVPDAVAMHSPSTPYWKNSSDEILEGDADAFWVCKRSLRRKMKSPSVLEIDPSQWKNERSSSALVIPPSFPEVCFEGHGMESKPTVQSAQMADDVRFTMSMN